MTKPPHLAIALLAGLLVACSGYPDRFPRLVNAPPVKQRQAEIRIPIPASGRASVAPGDTVYAISRRYGVTVRDVIEENHLVPPFRLTVGQTLLLPPPRSYTVRHGDTVFSISQRFNVDMRTLVSMNDLAPPYQVRAGRTLNMPTRGRVETPVRQSPGAGDGSTPPVVAGATPLPRPRPIRGASTSADRANVSTPSPGNRQLRLTSPPARAASRFLWPVRGRVISNFGPRAGGLHNDGINIAAPKGAPIRAAENGVVAYAGQGLRGFGNLLLIKHSGGWTTAYAHADRLLVRRGDLVKRGQTIGTIGSTGGVTRPQLHFEVRRGARAIDPRGQLDT